MKIVSVILSGDVGRLLWLLSREFFAKQCLPLVNKEYSLLQQTLLRILSLEVADPIVVCNESYRLLIVWKLQSIGVKKSSILLKPKGRNTASVVAFTALEVLRHQLDDSFMLVLPADHFIRDITAFEAKIKQDALVTFGVQSTRQKLVMVTFDPVKISL